MNVEEKIKDQLAKDKVVLYMKGSPDFPQCGFSAKVVSILEAVNANFQSYNVLDDEELRQGLKIFANWPTFPQLYVNGELVGGCDIITELYEKGELPKHLN